jgi:aspartyl protease family protein
MGRMLITGELLRLKVSAALRPGWGARSVLALILALSAGFAAAQNVSLVGIFGGNKAVLIVGDGPPRTVMPGEAINGVRLLGIGKESVTVDVSGSVQQLTLGDRQRHVASAAPQSVTLVADGRGHFSGAGGINGESVSFLVDTGASLVTMDTLTAQRIGLDLVHAEHGLAGTANGTIPTLRVKLDRVTLGGVTLRNVDGVVVQASLPQVLLGASFLNRMEMHREGSTMVLTQHY